MISDEEKEFFNESRQDVIRLDNEVNETSRALSAQLITLATLMVTLTAFFVGQSQVVHELNNYQKGFLVAGLATLIFSIALGVAEYFVAISFYKRSAQAHVDVVRETPVKENISELHRLRSEKLRKVPAETTPVFLYAQISSIALGVILYFLLVLTIIY